MKIKNLSIRLPKMSESHYTLRTDYTELKQVLSELHIDEILLVAYSRENQVTAIRQKIVDTKKFGTAVLRKGQLIIMRK